MIDIAGLPTPKDAPPAGVCVRIERPEKGLIRLVLDPPHRTLPVFDMPLLRDLDLALDVVEKDAGITGLVVTGRDTKTFAAGADIDAIAALTDRATVGRVVAIGQNLFERIDALSTTRANFTSVAAIGGAAPGGACELALACSFAILCDNDATRIGLPETMLGILPGWGGTTRLPRRIGLAKALEAILSGKLYTPREALRAGLVDRLCAPEDLLRIASDIAMRRTRIERRSRGAAKFFVDMNPLAVAFIASAAKKQVLSRTHGHYPAPLMAIDIAARANRSSTSASFKAEREAVQELATGPISKNLIRIFELSESAKKLKMLTNGRNAAVPTRVGVLGAGVMGRAIASSSADRGAWTRLFDIVPAALDTALIEHRADVESRLKKRKLQKNAADRALDRLDVTDSLVGFANVELVVEAVAERLDVKRKVFQELARQMKSDAILATNTSSLSVDAIASDIPHPERVVGLHFFNPVKRMPLVEIVRGTRTSPEVVARCAAFALALGKTPVVTKDCAGFLVNRLLGPYLDESLRLFAGGIDPARIDRSLRNFGMPMGPLALLDEVGFDIAGHAARSLHEAYGARMTPSTVLDGLVAEQRLGKKAKRGFYEHSDDRKVKPILAGDLHRFVPANSVRIRDLSDAEIAQRVVLAMLAEAARALEEHVVASARELDLATVFGMGFAPFRGGLLAWADTIGARAIVQNLEAIAREPDVAARIGGPERFASCTLLARLARDDAKFHAT
ncbi:MAG: 3-hydroxyacyl-CoA dehydrogenase NAD-binding domain-containing protein [Planctomycetota bacterium]|nr:3-hydroxyacyl-CoA dehydrogenase NAD-binding domain-containing protein [Planctomycetota bacterium]